MDDFAIKSIAVSNKDEDFIVSDLLVIGYLEIAGYSKYGVDLPICMIPLHPLLDNKTSGATIRLLLMFYCLVMDGAESRYRLGGLPDSEKSSPENKDQFQ